VPQEEKNPEEYRKTKRTLAVFIVFGAVVTVAMLLLWVFPYYSAL